MDVVPVEVKKWLHLPGKPRSHSLSPQWTCPPVRWAHRCCGLGHAISKQAVLEGAVVWMFTSKQAFLHRGQGGFPDIRMGHFIAKGTRYRQRKGGKFTFRKRRSPPFRSRTSRLRSRDSARTSATRWRSFAQTARHIHRQPTGFIHMYVRVIYILCPVTTPNLPLPLTMYLHRRQSRSHPLSIRMWLSMVQESSP